jgi:plasmid stabilization system protein ParE
LSRDLQITPRAGRDLDAAEDRFFAYAGPTPQALGRLEALLDAVADLVNTPVTWPLSETHPGVRCRLASGCRIFYEVFPDTGHNRTAGDVRILHVRLPGQNEPSKV